MKLAGVRDTRGGHESPNARYGRKAAQIKELLMEHAWTS
jgi:hypothetical protein